jgi:hypothetical protein
MIKLADSRKAWFMIKRDKVGDAALTVDHPTSKQSLVLPLAAIPEALRWLEPGFAHYVGQWEKFTTDEKRSGHLFGINASLLSVDIADPKHAAALQEIAVRHLPGPRVEEIYDFEALSFGVNYDYDSQFERDGENPEDLGITPYQG